jgi:NADH:ubiquinone oxidoreductase subunit 3 (subunit A)
VNFSPYSFLVTFAICALAASVVPLWLAWLWARLMSPNKPGPSKNASYECGLASPGTGWVQFKSDYYLYAIVFLIFDVETIFLLPFAAAFKGLSLGACVAMLLFLLLLVEGLVWACVKGVLSWK